MCNEVKCLCKKKRCKYGELWCTGVNNDKTKSSKECPMKEKEGKNS